MLKWKVEGINALCSSMLYSVLLVSHWINFCSCQYLYSRINLNTHTLIYTHGSMVEMNVSNYLCEYACIYVFACVS